MNPLIRKCRDCGVEISYSKADWKNGKIPENPLCGECQTRADGKKRVGSVEEIKVEAQVFQGQPIIGKTRRYNYKDRDGN